MPLLVARSANEEGRVETRRGQGRGAAAAEARRRAVRVLPVQHTEPHLVRPQEGREHVPQPGVHPVYGANVPLPCGQVQDARARRVAALRWS